MTQHKGMRIYALDLVISAISVPVPQTLLFESLHQDMFYQLPLIVLRLMKCVHGLLFFNTTRTIMI